MTNTEAQIEGKIGATEMRTITSFAVEPPSERIMVPRINQVSSAGDHVDAMLLTSDWTLCFGFAPSRVLYQLWLES